MRSILARGPSTTDAAWWEGSNGERLPVRRHEGFEIRAQTVELTDGTKIAVYVCLPKQLEAGARLPTVISLTPYFSLMEYRSRLAEAIVRKITISGGLETAEMLTPYGYAVVLMDLRGAGGSSGVRKSVALPDALRDGAEVIDWIVAQPWSNGSVGATGVSFVGMTAQWITITKHPALKAVAPRFTVFDIYTGTHPGGLSAASYVREAGRYLHAMESNQLHLMPPRKLSQLVMWALIRGIYPADDDPDRSKLAAAVADHVANERFDEDITRAEFSDDELAAPADGSTLATLSPFTYAADMEASEVPIYAFAGYYDAAFVRELVSLHNTVRTPGSKLIIGPCGHGGRFYTSPWIRKRTPTRFEQGRELARFFDHFLNGVENGVEDEPAVHYFTIGEERWKASETWPPSGFDTLTLHCSAGGVLTTDAPNPTPAADTYKVDMAHTTGPRGRLGIGLVGGRFPVVYRDRARADERALTYTGSALEQNIEVSGSPIVTVFVSSDQTDGAFHFYLEDVDPHGEVHNVTDGWLRGRARKVSERDAPYWVPGPWRTYARADAEPLIPGEVFELTVDLLPISYLFRRSHRIRLVIAGHDAGNFLPVPDSGPIPSIQVHHGQAWPSRVELPAQIRT